MGIVTRAHGAVRSKGADDPILTSKITVPTLPGWVVPRPRVGKLITDGVRGAADHGHRPAGRLARRWPSRCGPRDPPPLHGGLAHPSTPTTTGPRSSGPTSWPPCGGRPVTVPPTMFAPTRSAVDHGFLLRLASVLAARDTPVTGVLYHLHLVTEPAHPRWAGVHPAGTGHPALHFVMSSRMDPLLPLHRYRLAGELTEVRADDLAFSVPESGALLAHHGITLSAVALQCLTGRTEGWPAGVRLAALSLDGHSDPGAIRQGTGRGLQRRHQLPSRRGPQRPGSCHP